MLRDSWLFTRLQKPVWYSDKDNETLGLGKEIILYIENRVKPFTDNFHHKADKMNYIYLGFQVLIIIVSALITLINVSPTLVVQELPTEQRTLTDSVRFASAILGSITIASTAFLQLSKTPQSFIHFRIITAELQREYHKFIQKANDYAPKENQDEEAEMKKRNRLFVRNVESLIFSGTSEFYNLYREGGKPFPTPEEKTPENNNQ
jgi:hypothetical protein